MKNIHALRQSKLDLVAEAERLLASDHELTAQELIRVQEIKAKLATLEAEIIKVEEMFSVKNGVSMPDENGNWVRGLDGTSAGRSDITPGRGSSGIGRKYAQLFGKQHLDNGGFKGFGEFMQAFANAPAQFDPRLRVYSSSQQEDVPSLGGFSVPEEYAAMLLDKSLEAEVVRPRATQFGMGTETRNVPAFDGQDHTSTLFGGFAAQWISELHPMTAQAAKLRNIKLIANKLAILGNSSNEVLADAVNGFESAVGAAMIAATSYFLDLAFLWGSGAGQPLGVFNDPALIVVPKETGDTAQDADTFIFQNAVNMMGRLHPACFNDSVWVCNPSVVPQLLSMTFTSLSAVDGLRAPAVTQGSDGTLRLFTRPVIVSEKAAAIGDQGDVLLACFSEYFIGMRQGAAIEKSRDAGFLDDSSYFRTILRADGQGSWKSPVTPKHGPTLSWAITLQAR
ncbi:MAG TPA: phage major capsid protein [Candidatus Sulfotelmatobacter sp.]|nr:phage major capsid protein [Candidatus Sulfotelmatobacter sp.]